MPQPSSHETHSSAPSAPPLPAPSGPSSSRSLAPLSPSDPALPPLLNLSKMRWPQHMKIMQPPHSWDRGAIRSVWTFPQPPTPQEINSRVQTLLRIAQGNKAKNVLVSGPQFLTTPLVLELELAGIQAWFHFVAKRGEKPELLALIPAQPLTDPA